MSDRIYHGLKHVLIRGLLLCGMVPAAGCDLSEVPEDSSVAEVFVSPAGDDASAGTKASPLASLAGAWRRVSDLQDDAAERCVITLREGVYRHAASCAIQDGPDIPVDIRSFPGEQAVLTGGLTVHIRDFSPVIEDGVLQRIPSEARSRVMQLDLSSFSLEGLARMPLAGHSMGFISKMTRYKSGPQGSELFFNGQRQQLARWPNEGFVRTGKIIEVGDRVRGWMDDAKGGNAWGMTYLAPEERPDPPAGFCFQFDDERLVRWKSAGQFMMFGYWYYDWSDQTVQVQAVDPENRTLRSVQPNVYGVRPDQRFYVYDLLEELDIPGEWYIDHDRKILYFYPPEADPDAVIELSMLEAPVIQLRNRSEITLKDLSIRASRGDGIRIEGGRSVVMDGCRISNIGDTGIRVQGGREHRVGNCEIAFAGAGGMEISGGNRDTLESSGHVVENNRVHDYSVIRRTYTPGIGIAGVGIHVAHNEIANAPHFGIRFSGNDHLIEYNVLRDLLKESNDAGAIYAGRSWMGDGNVIRYNLFRNLSGFANGEAHLAAKGIYLDDGFSGTSIYGNIFDHVAQGVMVNGGRANSITANLFVDCGTMVRATDLSGPFDGGWAAMSWRTLTQEMERGKARWSSELWQSRFPRLGKLLDDEPQFPKNNRIVSNVCYNTEIKFDKQGIEERVVQYGTVQDNRVIEQSPGYFDESKQRYILKPDGTDPVLKNIPFLEIGRVIKE
jgi:hypothetical protein